MNSADCKKIKPLVSVIIPMYNSRQYVGEAIQSVLAQDYASFELIVSDDGSTDDSAARVKTFGQDVRYYNSPHAGIAAARNAGVRAARGDFFAFLDADDIWQAPKLAKQMDMFFQDASLDMCFTYIQQFFSGPDAPAHHAGHQHLLQVGYHCSTIVVKRESFFRVGFFQEKWKTGEFIDWYARAKDLGLTETMLPEALVKRRVHEHNFTRGQNQVVNDYARILRGVIDRRREKAEDRNKAFSRKKNPIYSAGIPGFLCGLRSLGKNLDLRYWIRRIRIESYNRKESAGAVCRDIFSLKKQELAAYRRVNKHLAGNRMKKFLILATPRSGSNLLRDLLSSHPEIHCDGELLAYRALSPRLLLEYYAAQSTKEVYGFKCFIHHCTYDQAMKHPEQFLGALSEQGWKIISLVRRNIFRQAISHILAQSTGAWTCRAPISCYRGMQISIKISRLSQLLDLLSVWRKNQEQILQAIPHITIEYAQDLLDARRHQAAAGKIFQYLNIPDIPVRTDMSKQVDRSIPELVSNYKEVFTCVSETPYVSFLEDDDEAQWHSAVTPTDTVS